MNRLAGVACAALWLAACGERAVPPPPAPPYTDPGYVDGAGIRLHYALTPTVDLPSAIAGSYGIDQRPNLALLAITLVPQDAGGARLDGAAVEATAVSLLGNRTPLALRRVDERSGPTWLATVKLRHREPVTIEIEARARADGAVVRARWTRSFPIH